MNDRAIQEWLSKRLSEFQAILQVDLTSMLANLRAEHKAATDTAKSLDMRLQVEGNARRAAEEDAKNVRLLFDKDIKDAEKARLLQRADELQAEVASIRASVKANY